MPLQTRLSSLITAIGADIKSLRTRVSTIETTPATVTLDGGSTPTETQNGTVMYGGSGGDMLHVGPTNAIPADRLGLWVDTSIMGKPTIWIKEDLL